MNSFLGTLLVLAFFFAIAPPAVKADGPAGLLLTPPAPKFSDAERIAELSRRRSALASKLNDKSILVLFSAEPKLYTNDVDYVFRQENNLYYLSNLKEPGATLIITKDGGSVKEFLFLRPRNPQDETWDGKIYSPEDAIRISGVKTVASSNELPDFLQALKAKHIFTSKDGAVSTSFVPETVYLLLPRSDSDPDYQREFRVEDLLSKELKSYKVENANPILAELRQIKSPYELKLLQHAIDITGEALGRSMGTARNATMEYEVQAELEYIFRKRNADHWGFPSIVGCGPNATTLHYEEASGPIKPGELLLMDVGAEYDHYSADVTRTFPVNGKFTKEQADIYRIVYDTQEAVAKAAKPGATILDLQRVAVDSLSGGLLRLGLITSKDPGQVHLWYMHGIGHWLGMNVHDVGRYGAPFKPGMVFTNEPGIYIREDALKYLPDTPENRAFIVKVRPAFEKYKNIGVRIEDDMLVTETGVVWLTKKIPRRLEEVEAYMARAAKHAPLSTAVEPAKNVFLATHPKLPLERVF